jgi:protein TonB
VALVAIIALHAVAIAWGLMARVPGPDKAQQYVPILLTLSAAARPAAEPPAVKVNLEAVLPQPVAPVIQINLPVEPPPTSIALVSTPAAPPVAVADAKLPASDGPVSVSDPDYLRLPTVVYPAAAKRVRAQGLVHVRALVDADGRPRDVSVARSSGFDLLDRAACDAVRGAVFKPYRRNNVAQSMVVIVPIDFSLKPARERGQDASKLDVRGKNHHAVRGHAEELGSLSAASLHVGE